MTTATTTAGRRGEIAVLEDRLFASLRTRQSARSERSGPASAPGRFASQLCVRSVDPIMSPSSQATVTPHKDAQTGGSVLCLNNFASSMSAHTGPFAISPGARTPPDWGVSFNAAFGYE
jgi:hypothetical protein